MQHGSTDRFPKKLKSVYNVKTFLWAKNFVSDKAASLFPLNPVSHFQTWSSAITTQGQMSYLFIPPLIQLLQCQEAKKWESMMFTVKWGIDARYSLRRIFSPPPPTLSAPVPWVIKAQRLVKEGCGRILGHRSATEKRCRWSRDPNFNES